MSMMSAQSWSGFQGLLAMIWEEDRWLEEGRKGKLSPPCGVLRSDSVEAELVNYPPLR